MEGFLDAEANETDSHVKLVGVPPSFVISIPKEQSSNLGSLRVGEDKLKDSRNRLRRMIGPKRQVQPGCELAWIELFI